MWDIFLAEVKPEMKIKYGISFLLQEFSKILTQSDTSMLISFPFQPSKISVFNFFLIVCFTSLSKLIEKQKASYQSYFTDFTNLRN